MTVHRKGSMMDQQLKMLNFSPGELTAHVRDPSAMQRGELSLFDPAPA